MIVRSVQNRDIIKRDAFISKLQNPLCHKFCLLHHIAQICNNGYYSAFPYASQLFRELFLIYRYGVIGQLQDFRGTSIICFKFKNLCFLIFFREFENVFKICTAKGINALGIIPHHHDVPVDKSHKINNFCLDFIGVLIFVNEDMREGDCVEFPQLFVFKQHFVPVEEKVIEIH